MPKTIHANDLLAILIPNEPSRLRHIELPSELSLHFVLPTLTSAVSPGTLVRGINILYKSPEVSILSKDQIRIDFDTRGSR
jgi:hypothetical protein